MWLLRLKVHVTIIWPVRLTSMIALLSDFSDCFIYENTIQMPLQSSRDVTSDILSLPFLHLKVLRSFLNSALLLPVENYSSVLKTCAVNFGQLWLAVPSDSKEYLLLESNHNIPQHFLPVHSN